MSADSLSECVEKCCSHRVKFSAMLAAAGFSMKLSVKAVLTPASE